MMSGPRYSSAGVQVLPGQVRGNQSSSTWAGGGFYQGHGTPGAGSGLDIKAVLQPPQSLTPLCFAPLSTQSSERS